MHPLKSNNVMLEDIYACEAVQRGMELPACVVGPLSKWEAPLTFFQQPDPRLRAAQGVARHAGRVTPACAPPAPVHPAGIVRQADRTISASATLMR